MEGEGGGLVSHASGGASAGHGLHPSGGSGLVQQHSGGANLEPAIKQQDDEQRHRKRDILKGELDKLRVHSQNTLERLKIAVRASVPSNHPAGLPDGLISVCTSPMHEGRHCVSKSTPGTCCNSCISATAHFAQTVAGCVLGDCLLCNGICWPIASL